MVNASRQSRLTFIIKLTAALALLLALLVALTLTLIHPPSKEERTVKVREGEFRFMRLVLTQSTKGHLSLDGTVQNKTSENWEEAEFRLDLFDDKGNRVGSKLLSIFDMKRGETRAIDQYQGDLGLVDSRVSRYEIRFNRGEYPPVHYAFVMVKPKESRANQFEDDLIDITFGITKKEILFTLHNKTNEPIRIDWQSASYTDVFGKPHALTSREVESADSTGEVRYARYTVVVPGADAQGWISPEESEFPYLFVGGPNTTVHEGMSFSVYLPISVGRKKNDYLFGFKIEKVEVEN